ncbi:MULTISPECIES: transglycosylase SLT domain-containing protein [unclassified Luteimonas]
MSSLPMPALRGLLLASALVLAVVPSAAQAQSRRTVAAIEALNQRMAAAETRWRDALVKIGNSDPTGLDESNAALEDMEDVIVDCGKLKGCGSGNLLASYKRLLKAQADAAAGVVGDEADDSIAEEGDLPTGEVPDSATAAALLGAEDRRFLEQVQMNPAVQAGIRRWLTDMRVALITSHENFQYMQHLMSPAFKRRGLPEALLFGILAKESNGRVHSRSRAGATGPLQFMPATGSRLGLGLDGRGFDTRYDPRASADAAAVYLGERYAELGGDNIELWLAAYNGGEGRARRVHREFGGRSFWDPDVYSQFPPETRDYVPMVIAAAWLYLHPREYGLNFPRVDTRPATFQLKRAASIYELTICLGNGNTRDGYMRVLRNLNPQYEAEAVIPQGARLNGTVRMAGLYERWCTKGARAELARQLVNSDPSTAIVRVGDVETVTLPDGTVLQQQAALSAPAATVAPAPAAPRTHRVASGETLVAIAQRYSCDTKSLAAANGIKPPRYLVRQGQQLKLEGCR